MAEEGNAAVAETSDQTAAPTPAGDRSTHFIFTHKLFSVKGAFFAISPATDEAVLNVTLGELKASLTIPTLAREFQLTPDTDDGKLLNIIAKSLKFVKVIHPGDSIPRELLDGSSSWTVEPHHHAIAKARLSVNLAAWATNTDAGTSDPHILQKMAEDPETKAHVNEALGEMAEKLGYGRENKEKVLEQVDTLARELAYIEALRERHGKVKMIERKLADAAKLYRRERSIADDVQRVQALMRTPSNEFNGIFQMVDAQTGEVVQVLRKMSQQIEFIRTMRDELHTKLMRWDEMIERWDPIASERGDAIEAAMRATYRFLARYFPQRSDWTLTVNKF
ncbi:MAG: hypothetical protein JNK67_30840 [Alphaproteobacteria bacterium]|nr:hypothetical protein [Alphaproteobacteria bacterium]